MTSNVEMQNFMDQEKQQPLISPPQPQETNPVATPPKGDTKRKRPTWDQKNNPIEFLSTTLGYLVGVSVLIRMPYMIYSHGGIVFLVQYLMSLLLFGFPVLLLEMYIGQFTSNGILTCWEMFPLFTGVGYAMLIICIVTSSSYAVINAWSVYYAFASWVSPLPWTTCDNAWNTDKCWLPEHEGTYNYSDQYNDYGNIKKVNPSVEYWQHEFLRLGDEAGGPLWYIALPLLGTWIIVALILLFGPKVYGKVAYVTTLLPYVIAVVLFLRFATLPGAFLGLQFLFYPNITYFAKSTSWMAAIISAFFHMGISVGPIITLSSYNKFRNDLVRDAFVLTIAQFVSCIGYAMLVFALYGFIAENNGQPINEVVGGGVAGLFTAMASGFGSFVGSQFWCCLFYLMVALMCTRSLLAMAETVITAILDLIPRLLRVRYIVAICVCFVLFLLGLPYTLHIGYAFFIAIDSSIYLNMTLVGLMEVVCVAFMYGVFSYTFTNHALFRFKDDLSLMFGGKACHCIPWVICWPFWAFMWCIVVPLILLVCWILNLQDGPSSLGYFEISQSLKMFCFFVMLSPVLAMLITPAVFLCIKCIKNIRLSRGLEYLIKPSRHWGPALPEDREGMSGYLPNNKFEIDPWQ